MVNKTQIISREEYLNLQKEMEDFTYIVSHDFNAPLRHVREFTKLLMKKIEDKIGEDERKYVRIIDQSIQNSEQMLEGLLQISRLNTNVEPLVEVDCNKIVDNVIVSLSRQINRHDIELSISDMPTIHCYEGQMNNMFRQLMDNAIKFRNKDVKPKIAIKSSKIREGQQFWIEDNGIGVDEGYEEKIFQLFKKVYSGDDSEGNGVGLTLCKKIAEKHGGDIWFERPKKGGSVFTFTTNLNAYR